MRIAITGSGGLIGRALTESLVGEGHEVVRLVRRQTLGPHEASYDPETDFRDAERVERCRAFVHLAGADPGARQWTDADRVAWRRSRYESTRKVCQNVAMLRELPEVLVCASSLAFYGSRPGEVLDETSARGSGEWAAFAEDWESAAEMAEAVGMRLVTMRFAPVLASGAGLLGALEATVAAGTSAVVGLGANRVATVELVDAVRALRHVIEATDLSGPLVVAEPGARTQAELATARVPARPGAKPLSPPEARARLGDVHAEAWCADRAADPAKLLESGFRFSGR